MYQGPDTPLKITGESNRKMVEKNGLKMVYVTWIAEHRRSMSIAREFDAKDIYVEYLKGKPIFLYPLRYLLQGIKTYSILRRENPDVLISINPPIFAPLFSFLYSKIFNKKYIIDSHTGAFSGFWGKFLWLHKILSRHALMTIVTNKVLKDAVKSWGAKAVILEDSLHDLVSENKIEKFPRFSICVINSYLDDEPIDQVFEAAKGITDCDFYVTGKIAIADPDLIKSAPVNVHLTDFIPDKEFVELLNKVDAIMVLTTRDLTLLQGGFEAVAVEKPLITSDWPVLRDYFRKGTLYVDNRAESISNAIKEIEVKKNELTQQIKELKKDLKADWDEKFSQLKSYIYDSYK